MSKRKNRWYLVTNQKGYNFGAFPYTKEGKAKAKKYIEEMKKKCTEKLHLSL